MGSQVTSVLLIAQVIFYIEDFERFTQRRQTLLYSLFNAAQTASVPVGVIGVCRRMVCV
jgi:hypothetical protein